MRVYKDASDEWLLECYKYDYGIITDASVFAWLIVLWVLRWYFGSLDSQSQAGEAALSQPSSP